MSKRRPALTVCGRSKPTTHHITWQTPPPWKRNMLAESVSWINKLKRQTRNMHTSKNKANFLSDIQHRPPSPHSSDSTSTLAVCDMLSFLKGGGVSLDSIYKVLQFPKEPSISKFIGFGQKPVVAMPWQESNMHSQENSDRTQLKGRLCWCLSVIALGHGCGFTADDQGRYYIFLYNERLETSIK